MKKIILVTGSNGFIGKKLCEKLISLNFGVVKHSSEDGKVEDTNFIEKYGDIKISQIFHLASKTFVPDSWEKPNEFYMTSVIGTNNILELCRKKNIPLTFVSSYLYGEPKFYPINEEHPLDPNNPYSHSKYLSEELCRFYSNHYNTKIIVLRPFNIYGEGQKDDFLISSIIKQVMMSESNTIYLKDLSPKRDYIYINDVLEGLVKTMNLEKKFSIYNLGSGKSLSVKEVVSIVQKVFNTNKKVISESISRKNEISNVVADISKAKKELNWKPMYSFEEGIKNIFEEKK